MGTFEHSSGYFKSFRKATGYYEVGEP